MKTKLLQNTAYFLFFFINEILNQRRVILIISNAFYASTQLIAVSNAEMSRSVVIQKKIKDGVRAGSNFDGVWASSPSEAGGKGGKVQEPNYVPTVSITTQLINNSPNTQHANSPISQQANLLEAIKYNGSGIPEAIKEKVFQPFFTTKFTEQDTGLGLSLSYDIMIAQGRELKVERKEKESTEFIITLPYKNNA